VRIIDYYENTDQGLEHYAQILREKGYTYGRHIAPHDIMVREFTAGGVTRFDKASQLGIRFTVAPKIPIIDGIECVRSTFSKMWIDETNCKDLIKALENYRKDLKKSDTAKPIYADHPLHNWASNAADAMRMLCIGLPKIREGTSPEDLEKRYREAYLGPNSSLPPIFRTDLPDR
jgi:hypothetical protein